MTCPRGVGLFIAVWVRVSGGGAVEPWDWLGGDWRIEEGTEGFPGGVATEVDLEEIVWALAEVGADASEVGVVGAGECFAVEAAGAVEFLADDGLWAVFVCEFVFPAFSVVFDALEPCVDVAEGEDELAFWELSVEGIEVGGDGDIGCGVVALECFVEAFFVHECGVWEVDGLIAEGFEACVECVGSGFAQADSEDMVLEHEWFSCGGCRPGGRKSWEMIDG